MKSKLALCYELSIEDLKGSVDYLKEFYQEIQCVSVVELEDSDLREYDLYVFHLNLNTELQTHQQISQCAKKNNLKILNPYPLVSNLFDDKYLFANFLLSNSIRHPKTFLIADIEGFQAKDFATGDYFVKARHGTESKDLGDLSKDSLSKILSYDDALIQEKINISKEFKILRINGEFYSNLQLTNTQIEKLIELDKLIMSYLELNNNEEVCIYSIDLLEDINGESYILEINLRPGAFYRFIKPLNLKLSQ